MPEKFFVFSISGKLFAIDLFAVDKVIPAIEIMRVPDRSGMLAGIINVHGVIVPVLNIRKKYDLQEREIDVDDFIVLVKVRERNAAFIIDSVRGVFEISDSDIATPGEIYPDMDLIEGMFKISGEIVLIHDPEKFISAHAGELASLKAADKYCGDCHE